MTKFKKMTAVLLAVLMVFGSMSVLASALRSDYLDEAIINQYNSIDKAELTTEQQATLILDELDVMLTKEDIVLDIPLIGTIDLTSVDAAMDSIYNLTGNWLYGSLTVGDLFVLEDHRSDIATNRRASANNSDMAVINSLVTYLANCAPTLLGMFGDDFNWGIVHGFLPPEFRMIIDDFNGWLDDLIWDLLHPVNDEVMTGNPTLDDFVQFLCDNQLAGLRPEVMGFEGVMPGFIVDVDGDTAYRVIEEGIYEALNAFIVPILNSSLKTVIREAVESNQADGGELYELIDTNYVIEKHTFDTNLGLVDQLNDVLGVVVGEMLLEGKSQWVTTAKGDEDGRSNAENLTRNLEVLIRQIIVAGGDTEDVDDYTLEELGDYIARAAVEQFVDHLDFEVGDTMEKIAYEGLRELVVRFVPEVTYLDLETDDEQQYRDGILEMGADIACYYLNANLGLDCAYSTTANEFILAFLDWCMPYIDGLFAKTTEYNNAIADGDGWGAVDAILWQFIPKAWFNYAGMFANNGVTGTADDLTFKSLLDYIMDALLDLDVNKIFTFFTHDANSDLTKHVDQFIIQFVANILNTAFDNPTTSAKNDIVNLDNITNFESIINPIDNASALICGILKTLAQSEQMRKSVLNIVVMIMGLADPQSLGELDVDLDGRINATSGSVPSGTVMRLSNYSDGINSGWRPEGVTAVTQDRMYVYEIVSIFNNTQVAEGEDTPEVTTASLVSTLTPGVKINANSYLDVPVSGTVAADSEVRFDITYYILDENGNRINNGTPLVKSVYTHLYTVESTYYAANSASSSANNVTFEDFATYYYTTDVYTVSLFSILATNESGLVTNAVDVTKAIVTGNLPAGIAANAPADDVIVHIDDSSVTSDTYGTVNPYVSNITDPDAAQPYGIYNVSVQFEVRGRNWLGQTTTATTEARSHVLVIYDDFGLPGLLDEIMGANRQRVDFADDATAEWNAYLAAVADGYALLNGNPDHDKMFVDLDTTLEGVQNEYSVKVNAINAAVEALDAKAKPTNAALLAALNAEIAEYADVDSDNYVLFTYDRFEDAYDHAASLANSQVAPEDEADFVAPSIPMFDLVYATQQLNLWGGRLIERTTDKTQLNNLLNPVENWTEDDVAAEWWDAFDAARDAAVLVKNDADALQTEVNDARINLMIAMKGIKPRYLYAVEDTATVIDSVNMLIYGIDPEAEDIEEWVEPVSDYDLSCELYVEDSDYIGTGSTVKVYNDSDLIATFTVVLFGDINGDGEVTSDDADLVDAYLNGDYVIDADSVFFMVADVNHDGTIDSDDSDAIRDGDVSQTSA
ncbi:MAG: dockerin type I repeat-containing protein [Clostridia bacterium]|nr:dockerin type I repeat-containing protein [Clostridia bacterium]MBQ6863660.1 dockerin type I repeat-containing protein [Clostridia bacterium]